MEITGKIKDLLKNFRGGKWVLTLELDTLPTAEEYASLCNEDKPLDITIKKHKEKRSLNANALLWKCLTEIAQSMTPPQDKWVIYLYMLKRYGKYTYICVKPNVVEAVKKQWRECEEVGMVNINGEPAVQMLCYFGSSTYDSKEFSVLLDGVMSEMKELGLQLPLAEHVDKALRDWEEHYGIYDAS